MQESAQPIAAAVEPLKLPPQSVEAEQSLLGGLLLDNSRFDLVADRIGADDFYLKQHRLIFRAVSALCAQNAPADVITVSEWLQKNEGLEEAGGLAYLATLANNTPSAANIAAYADIVYEHAVLRGLIRVANRIASGAYRSEGRSAAQLLDEAEEAILQISEGRTQRHGRIQPFRSLLKQVVDRIDKLFHSTSPLTGVPTGFTDLDSMTSGLQAGDLIIVAGRPSMGKTSLAMNIAEHAAISHQVPIAIFSMEMPSEQLAMRMLASYGRINAHKVRTGKLADDDWPELVKAMGVLEAAPIFIDDTPALTALELRARARRLKREHGLGLIIVDYLQLMQPTETIENRATEIANMTRALKTLAKEQDVPVVVMSQLNRSVESRTDKRPVMSDLRESGAIEQDADVILFIYRDEVYNEDSPDRGVAEIIIGKQRNGPTGKVRLTFLGEYTRFENYAGGGFDEGFR
jgi:replicative DNA helicase